MQKKSELSDNIKKNYITIAFGIYFELSYFTAKFDIFNLYFQLFSLDLDIISVYLIWIHMYIYITKRKRQ